MKNVNCSGSNNRINPRNRVTLKPSRSSSNTLTTQAKCAKNSPYAEPIFVGVSVFKAKPNLVTQYNNFKRSINNTTINKYLEAQCEGWPNLNKYKNKMVVLWNKNENRIDAVLFWSPQGCAVYIEMLLSRPGIRTGAGKIIMNAFLMRAKHIGISQVYMENSTKTANGKSYYNQFGSLGKNDNEELNLLTIC